MRKPRELQHLKSSRTTVGRGIPRNDEGSDGDLALRITNTGLKLFAKYQNKWYIVGEYMKEAVLDEKRQPRHLPFTPGNGGFFNNQGGVSVPKGALLDFGGLSKSNTLGVNVSSSITNETSNALLTVDSLHLLSAHAVGSGSFVRVPHTAGAFECKKIYITDSYGNVLGDTYIASPSADELTITVGGESMLHFIQSTTNTMESAEIAEYLIRSGTTADPVLHLKNTTNDATSATLKFTNERSGGGNVGVNNDRAGIIEFWAEDDAGNSTNVGTISSSISDVTDGSEDGYVLLEALGGTTSEIKLDSSGIVTLDAANGNDTFGVQFALNGTTVGDITGHHAKTYFTLYENIGASTNDKFYIACAANGATEIATQDGAGTAANLTIVPDGSLSLEPSSSLTLKSSIHQLEQAAADADQVAYGQIWVKNEDPNELYFTNDDGDDIQITSKDHLAPTEAIRVQVRNDEGSTIAAGAPLYSKGEVGGSERILVGVCDADDASKMPCIGIAYEEMNTSSTQDNFAVVTGIYNTNISGFTGLSVGDNLYVQTDGSLSQDKPTATDELIQNIGIVLRTNGSICQGLFVSAIGRTNDVPNTNERPLCIKERADAGADAASYGQLWVHDTTPNELAFTDDAGTDIIGIGKYHYETKICNFYASVLSLTYLPIAGYVVERTSSAGQNEYISMIAPFDGTLEKFAWRSEAQQGTGSGTMRFIVNESQDGTEVPGTAVYRKDLTGLNIADDTYTEFDLTSPSIGSYPIPITKGRIYNFAWTPAAIPYDTNTTLVFKWDVTS